MVLGTIPVSYAVQTTAPYEGYSVGPPQAATIAASGDTLVVGYRTDDPGDSFLDGFAVYDLTDPAEPSMVATVGISAEVWDLVYDAPYLYVAADSLEVYDMTTPSAPALIESGTISSPFQLAKSGNTLYVCRWSPAQVSSVDVTDPTTPVQLDTIDVGTGNGNTVDATGTLVAVGARNGGHFTLIDASNPSAMAEDDSIPGDTMGVRFLDGNTLVATHYTDIAVWDVSVPSSVATLSTDSVSAGAWSLTQAAGTVYVGTGDRLVSPFDASVPSSISRLPDYMMPGRAYDLVVVGDYLYAAGYDAGLVVIPLESGSAGVYSETLAGSTRYATAIESSRRAFPDGADTVVIATGENWPDALGGSALAGAVDGPILLTPTNALRSDVLDEIRDLGASNAIILGGTAAVSDDVEQALNDELGDVNVDRIAGATRYETSELVARAVDDVTGWSYDVFVATGKGYPDAAAVSPAAAARQIPILLVPDAGFPTSSETLLDDLYIEQAMLLGGTGAVTSEVEADLVTLLGAENVERIQGADRYATAAAVAQWSVSHLGMTWNGVGVATGQSFPDALTGGVTQGKSMSVMLLTKSTSLPSATASQLGTSADEIGVVRFYGGTGAVSTPVRDQILGIVQ